MAKNQSRRLPQASLKKDRDTYAALQAVSGYAPSNTDYTLTKVTSSFNTMDGDETADTQTQAEADAARDDSVKSQWEFHNMILSAKEQAIAQFGKSSNEVQSIGLKKKSEYKAPKKKSAPPA